VRGLLVDYGGVLTSSAARAFREFEDEHDLPKGTVFELITEAYERGGDELVARIERGEATVSEFSAGFRAVLAERGIALEVEDVVEDIFGRSRRVPDMWDVVGRAGTAGVRTALVSNSWGTDGYPVAELDEIFDALVISGDVGLRKPDPEIYLLAAERIGLEPLACAFVDDLARNVDAARELGMFGVHHRDVVTTARALEDFLEVALL
jgi:putative hydrolase of the HAD superfamily